MGNENEIRNLNDNEVSEVSGGFRMMEAVSRECNVCGRHWTERHPMGSCWVTESICESCRAERQLKESIKQQDKKNINKTKLLFKPKN